MTGYVTGDLITADGADDLLRTAEASIPFAQAIGCPSLNLHGTGLGEGGIPVRPVEVVTGEMWLAAVRTLSRIAELGRDARRDVRAGEPQHRGRPPRHAVRAGRRHAGAGRAVDSPHLKMNLDLYHAQIGEGNLVELIRRAAPHVGEVQVADVPGRCEPGTGEVRWPFVARALADAGYDGVVAMEAFAIDPAVEGSDRALERLPRGLHPLTSLTGPLPALASQSVVGANPHVSGGGGRRSGSL